MRKRLKNIGALLLLVLFAGYWSCVTLFPHVHRIDGLLYVHSHPYSGPAGNPTHSHSAQQFQLIAHLSLLVMALATLAALVRRPEERTFLFGPFRPAAGGEHPARGASTPRAYPALHALRMPRACPDIPCTFRASGCACPVHPGAPFGHTAPMRAPRLRAAPPRRPAVPHPCGACNPPFTTQRNNPT